MIIGRGTHLSPRARLTSAALACAAAGALPLAASPAAEETVTFGFSPPDRATFVETMSWTRVVKNDGEVVSGGKKQGRIEYHIRRTGDGYSVTAKPLEAPVTASRELGLTIQDLFASATLTYQLDSKGQLVRVVGADAAARRMFEILPEEEGPFIKDLLTTATQGRTMAELAAAGWNGRAVLGFLAGKTLSLKKPYTSRGEVAGPMGLTLTADVTVEAYRSSECPNPDCVAISVKYTSRDPRLGVALTNFVRGTLLQTLREFDTPAFRAQRRREGAPIEIEKLLPAFQYGDFSMESDVLRLLDTVTGLPHLEVAMQTIRGNLQVEGQQATFELSEGYKNTYRRSLVRVPGTSPR